MTRDWLTFDEAVEIAQNHLAASVGRSQAAIREARASGEVRLSKPGDDDGITDFDLRPGTAPWGTLFNRDDLLDWLTRQAQSPVVRVAPQPEDDPKLRPKPKQARVLMAIEALWPEGLPEAAALSNARLTAKVADWIKVDCQSRGLPADIPSDDTILRASGRKS